MAATLAAFYKQIPVGHVEAGLRTHNIYSPWPEEMNRLLTERIATWHFAPTPLSRENLLQEHVPDSRIIITGNTEIDVLYWVVEKIKKDDNLNKELETELRRTGYDTFCLSDGPARADYRTSPGEFRRGIHPYVQGYKRPDTEIPLRGLRVLDAPESKRTQAYT